MVCVQGFLGSRTPLPAPGWSPSHALRVRSRLYTSRRTADGRRRTLHTHVRASPKAARNARNTETYNPTSAQDAIETGLTCFNEKKDFKEALRLFQASLEMSPSDDEARAAWYNIACCQTKLKAWDAAAQAVQTAVNEYNLKYTVAVESVGERSAAAQMPAALDEGEGKQDKDLAPLRERKEWITQVQDMQGNVSQSTRQKLRAEAKAPFRLSRLVIFGGLLVGASVGLLVIAVRLIAAVRGGDGAPDLQETVQNFGINLAAVAVLGFLVNRDRQGVSKDESIIEREEALSLLQVELRPGRVLPLLRLRGTYRPVLLVGSKTFVKSALKQAESFRRPLQARGVVLVPLVTSGVESEAKLAKLKAEFAAASGAETGGGGGGSGARSSSSSKGFAVAKKEEAEAEAEEVEVDEASGRAQLPDTKNLELKAFQEEEWLAWVREQQQSAGVKSGDIYIQVQLDGTVRTSGGGMPPWNKWLDDISPLDSMLTKLREGVGTDI